MYLDAILEVSIGLVLTWLVLSIATMQVEEWISGYFRWRAQLLEKSIARMLNGTAIAVASGEAGPSDKTEQIKPQDELLAEGKLEEQKLEDRTLVEDFYNHPSIASLAQTGKKPSYIPSDRFAQTLFDVVFNRAEELKGLPIPTETLRLEDVIGIGSDSASRLRSNGIYTVEQLAELTPEQLRGYIQPFYERIAQEDEILQHAKKLLESVEETRRT